MDTQVRRLFYKNEPVDLSSRAFDILSYLIQKRGEIIEKDELLQVVWSDSFVEEGNLAVHISALRRILNEKRGESRFIKTISGRGYCFIAPVEIIDKFHVVQNHNDLNLLDGNTLKDKENSVAVLPFTFDDLNLNIDYLAIGLTQDLISDLSKMQNCKVMAYSAVKSYKNTSLDLQEVGFLLGVQKVLTGHISDRKDKLQISVELIDAADKSHIWGMQYDFDFADILQVKKNILLIVAEKLNLRSVKSGSQDYINTLSNLENVNPVAFKFYLKGKYILGTISTRSDLKKDLNAALGFFRNAVKEDSNYALAYVGIGETYIEMFHNNLMDKQTCHTESKKALKLALKINNQLSEAHILKGIFNIHFERNLLEAEQSLMYAIELDKNNPEAFHWLSYVNICFGKFELSDSLQRKAVTLDPISIRYNNGVLRVFYFSEDYNKLIVHAEEVLEVHSRSISAYFFLAVAYAHIGLIEEAFSFAEKTIQIRSTPDAILTKAYIYALKGERKQAEKIISEVLNSDFKKNLDYTYLATVYSALNDKDKAFSALNKAYEMGGAELILLKVHPKFKNLRDDPRFSELLKKINLI